MAAVYAVIIALATTVGAICGMGGGVIIKPLLDAVSSFSSFQISVISGACVLAMSVSSLVRHFAAKTKFQPKLAVCLAVGSVAGGLLGDWLYDLICEGVTGILGESGDYAVKIVQNAVLALLIVFVLIYMLTLKPRGICLHMKSAVFSVAVGCVLGILSSFLGIGGGPVNVCVFCLLYGMSVKDAGVNSLITIFFSQLSKFAKMFISGSIFTQTVFDSTLSPWLLIIMVAVAVAGGILGAVLNRKLSDRAVNVVYCVALGAVLLLCVYNIVIKSLAL